MNDKALIDGLKAGDTKSIEKIYELCFPKVRALILKNNGSESDAYDVFQEALELMLLKMDTFKMNLEGMIILICKRKWIDKLRSYKTNEKFVKSTSLQYNMQEDVEQVLIEKEKAYLRTQLLEHGFQQLSETCMRLMTMVKEGLQVEDIVKKMSFSSANTLYRRKAACMKRWSELVKQDIQYSQYFE